jgi:hypothetical protein
VSDVTTYYWHDGKVYSESRNCISECTWERAQEICAGVSATMTLFVGGQARILRQKPPWMR